MLYFKKIILPNGFFMRKTKATALLYNISENIVVVIYCRVSNTRILALDSGTSLPVLYVAIR